MGNLKEYFNPLKLSLRRFLSLSFILASMILVVRLFEIFFTSNFSNYPPGSFLPLLTGIKFDIILYLRISGALMIPFLIVGSFSARAAKYFFIACSIILILADMLLLKYFSKALVPLGADLFGYSITEIRKTVQLSGDFKLFPFITMTLYLALMVRVFIKHVHFRVKPWAMALLTSLMFASFFPFGFLNPKPSHYNNEFSMFAATNKLNFFAQSVSNHYIRKGKINKEEYVFKTFNVSANSNSFTYIDPNYPFLHNETTPDVLGEYFDLGETPPNIVFIIVESLGRAYSGRGAYLGSFTPFVDSLMQKSLYWENCLSTSGRTFQVLPSLLASAPFGEHGFAELEDKMPDHISLISLLKKQANYSSTFVYGGEAEFDKMDVFMNRQGVDQIIDSRKFGTGYSKLPATPNGFSWGYGDREIFRRYVEELKKEGMQPRLDVILTVAMHDPFNVPDEDKYARKFEERMSQLKLSEKTQIFNNNYSKQFASVMYFEESIQNFFSEMKKLPSFSNTIFVITGDHRMPEIPISTQLDRFHVPLVIYSPLLKKAEKFSSVVTHFDIAPSIIALLDSEKYISRPTVASWIGNGLDNSVEFRNRNSFPFMRNKNEILDFINSEDFLAANTLYQIYGNMDIEPVDNREKQEQLKNELDNFIRMNNYACENNKLIPDSLKIWTVK
ncbi:MAG TPA: LTA synthase family protein [Draconibacterium sp.]|nr:LTA synthase family protein [Draconibacterium sp.]